MSATSARRVDWVWEELPARVGRRSLLLGAVLTDGDHLRAWPRVALVAPPAALVTGGIIAAILPEGQIYTYSIFVMAILAAIAGLGAALGLWAWIGFVIGDLLLNRPQWFLLPSSTPSLGERLEVYLALFIGYVLLAALLVLSPVIGTTVRLGVTRTLEAIGGAALLVGMGLQAAVQGAFAFMWAQGTAFLIRPIWTFQGGAPDVTGIYPLQHRGETLVAVTVAAVAVRTALTVRGLPRRQALAGVAPAGVSPADPGSASLPGGLPVPVAIPLQAVFLTLLLSGLLSSVRQGLLVGVLVAVILLLQSVVAPRLPVLPAVVERVPPLLRVAVVIALAYVASSMIVAPASGGESFFPVVETALISMAIAALLFPARAPPAIRGRR